MCGRNVAVSFFAARRRARPVNPVERCNPVSVSSRAVARPTGRYCPQVRNAHIANARGPIRTGDPAGASTAVLASSALVQSAVVTTPQQVQVLDSNWYSVITGTSTGDHRVPVAVQDLHLLR